MKNGKNSTTYGEAKGNKKQTKATATKAANKATRAKFKTGSKQHR